MFLPKVIYENLPFSYILISIYLLISYNNQPLVMSSTIFYCAACITFVRRSANRRQDKVSLRSLKVCVPELIYEYTPYSVIAISVIVLSQKDHFLYQIVAISLLFLALRHLLCRHFNRLTRPSKL